MCPEITNSSLAPCSALTVSDPRGTACDTLVSQTSLAAEASRFATDFDEALADEVAMARDGLGHELSQRVRAAMKSLRTQTQVQGRELFWRYAEMAIALPDEALAHALCEGFEWTDFAPEDASALARLAGRWGAPWMQALIHAWATRSMVWRMSEWDYEKDDAVAPWPWSLADFVRKCEDAALEAAVIEAILDLCQAALIAADGAFAAQPPILRRATLDRRLWSVGDLAAALQRSAAASQRQAALVHHVQAYRGLYPLRQLRPLVMAWPSEAAMIRPVQALRAAVVQALQKAVDEPVLLIGDCSLRDIEWTCSCHDCGQVAAWAESPSGQPLMLPLSETRRHHVQSRLQEAGAAIEAETLKQGSRYKLVLRKPANYAALRSAQRRMYADDLTALNMRAYFGERDRSFRPS